MFSFHEFSTAFLSVHVIYAVDISGPVLNHFRTRRNVVINACVESKTVFSRSPVLFSIVHVHTLAGAHIHAHALSLSHKSTYTLNLVSVFSMADSVPKVHLQR